MNHPPDSGPIKCVRIKRNGEPCGNWPIRGATVCRSHGGAAKQVRQAAQRRLEQAAQERAALEEARRFGLLDGEQPPDDLDPRSELLTELWRSSRVVSQLEAAGPTPADRGLWQAWHAQREHLRQVAESCHRAGVDEHRLAIESATAQAIASVIRAVVSAPELGLAPDQRDLALRLVGQELRLLEGGDGDGSR